jgi:glycosyltransferase involved in cell wall biosynthesis
LIVVDDGSKDGSPAVVRSLKDRRIRLIVQKNAGVSAARNRAVKAAKGRFVAFLDSDDDWDRGYLAALKGLIDEYPGAGLYATNYRVDNGVARVDNPIPLPSGWRGRMKDYYELSYHGRPPFSTNTVCLPASLAKAIPFPLGIKAGEDLLVWFEASLRHETAYWNKPFATYYVAVTDNTHATYFGSPYHLDWLEVGDRFRKKGLLTPSAQKYVVWATLIQIRKMIANGYRAEALAKWGRCPKTYFPFYQARLLALFTLPAKAPQKLRALLRRPGKRVTTKP